MAVSFLTNKDKEELIEIIESGGGGSGTGADGKSAYEIAVENGFEGTEAEWLESLKGEPGLSITNAYIDSEGRLCLDFSDGTGLTTADIVTGEDGRGIASIQKSSIEGQYHIYFTDGSVATTFTLPIPNFTIGTVETIGAGQDATVTITGTAEDPVLNFKIPEGCDGDNGDDAIQPGFEIGTVTTLEAGSNATVELAMKTDTDFIFNFGIPKGEDSTADIEIVQAVGESQTAVMSQNAVTNEFLKRADAVDDYSAQQIVRHDLLSGRSKLNDASRYVIQTEEADSTILIDGNNGTVEHLSLSNPNEYSDKVGIDVPVTSAGGTSQKLCFYDIYIDSNYKYGVRIPKAWYNQFISCWIQGTEAGIVIGEEDAPENWNGVLDFSACHFNNSKKGVVVYAKETNTICLDKCSFEGSDLAIENNGTLYARGTYVGDQLNNGNYIGVLAAKEGSKTYFNDCTLGISSYADGGRSSIFDLNDGSEVHIVGGTLGLSNNFNVSGSESTIYASNNENDLIYIDFARFIQPESNLNHCRIPYYIYDGYSPLRSKFPVKNYISNGTMNSDIGNSLILQKNNNLSLDSSMVNPFSGKVLRANGDVKYFYRVPKHLIGAPMTLELYLYTPSTEGFSLTSAELGLSEWNETMHEYESERRPCIYRIDVTPTAEIGSITLSHTSEYVVYGAVLKEARFKEFLSCYEDDEKVYSDSAPTTTNATKGDVVYNTSNGYDWKFDGTEWKTTAQVTYTLEGENGVVTLVGSDGSRSTISIVMTKTISYTLTHCQSSNGATEVAEDTTYRTVIFADSNYAMANVTVLMGGEDITAEAYNAETGEITILAVTGAVVITAVAEFVEWTVGVENFAVAVRMVAQWRTDISATEPLQFIASNQEMIMATSTENVCPFDTRESTTLYLIPVPDGAIRVNVTTTDTKVAKVYLLGLTVDEEKAYGEGRYSKVFEISENQVPFTYSFENGSIQYLAATLSYDGENNVEWDYDNIVNTDTEGASQISITFSNYIEE